MKRFFKISVFALFLFLAGACARHKIIPDKKLALIFRDAFLTNAYVDNRNIDVDSLNLYEPIFAKYGYTTSDVQYTIGNFSKRKSARLGDVVERAIEMLEAEGAYYDREVAILDTVDNIARRVFTRTVLSDSLIKVKALRDTSKLRLAVDVVPGDYEVRFTYLVDSLDQNEKGIRANFWLERRDSSRTNNYTTTLRRNRSEEFSRRFTADTSHRRLHIDIFDMREKPLRPSITVTDLSVKHIPAIGAAVDSLYEHQLNIRIFADEFFRAAIEKDSL